MKQIIATLVFFSFLVPVSALALTPNDDYYNRLWYLPQVSADTAWDTQTGSSDVVVAVLDAGVDMDHPDLLDNFWINSGEIPNNNIDDDSNGYVDDVNGWDFIDQDNFPAPSLEEGSLVDAIEHGSMVAGIIGAVGNNGRGVTGVGWNVKIMPIRTLDSVGSGSSYETARALDYAVENGADVINLSFSGTVLDTRLQTSIRKAYESGVVVVSAMGNDDTDSDITQVFPACFGAQEEDDWVIGVASTTKTDEKADFSNYGSNCTDISAPGVNIVGIKYHDPSEDYISEYGGNWSGTSMSAPIVSGAAALLLSEYKDLSPKQVRTILMLSVDPVVVESGMKGKMGAGRLNIARALEYGSQFVAVGVTEFSFIRGQSSSSVYAVIEKDRYIVPDTNTYFTYRDSFDDIETVADTDLKSYSLKGVVLPNAGVVLVKIQSDPRVYALQTNGDEQFSPRLREITSESVAVSMYGTNWADYVIDVSPTFFTKFTSGSKISSPETANLSIMKTREELFKLSR